MTDYGAKIVFFKTSFCKRLSHVCSKSREKRSYQKEEVDEIICWLTGYSQTELEEQLQKQVTFEQFLRKPLPPILRSLITGVVCGVRVENIEDKT